MRTSRVEAFSDGVLAIIITIMVLELRVPEGHEWTDLFVLWPKVLSYLISFVYVGIYWNNHHHLFQLVEWVNGAVLLANLHLLFWLSLFPFVTAWAGESHFAAIPMTCYGAVALMAAISYTILQVVIVRAHESNSRVARAAGSDRKGRISIAAYLVAIIAPFFGEVGVWVSGVCLAGVAVMWFLPDRRVERTLAEPGPS
ncbi:MAG TPA: TMEM175 family protein [Propionicimonas sp.]|uniref:TMEM175 family protein n=1 Tax=Propionicimonas sp. TaxID=1955623 RepID=UPI002F422BB1